MIDVLIGCEKSGIVRDAFIDAGIPAISCDLEPTQRPGPHMQCDIFDAVRSQSWRLIILHPECIKVCLSGNGTYAPGMPKHKQRLEQLDWIRDLWLTCQNYSLRAALENPVGCLRDAIGPAAQYVQPYEFGHDASKTTGFWLYNLPKLTPTGPYIEPSYWHNGLPRWGNQAPSGADKTPPRPDRSAIRAETYPGIARAMADQWGVNLNWPIQLELFGA